PGRVGAVQFEGGLEEHSGDESEVGILDEGLDLEGAAGAFNGGGGAGDVAVEDAAGQLGGGGLFGHADRDLGCDGLGDLDGGADDVGALDGEERGGVLRAAGGDE